MPEDDERIEIEVTDEFRITDRLVAEKRPGHNPARVTSTRVSGSSQPFSSAADVEEDGTISFEFSGQPQLGEEGILDAASHVRERLAELGEPWIDVRLVPPNARTERGVDVVAFTEGDAELGMQVTRAEQTAWKTLKRTGRARGRLAVADLVEALWAAIRRKKKAPDREVVLVVDAANAAHFADYEVVAGFRDRYGHQCGRVGFRDVWLAGPTAERTMRLDRVTEPGSLGLPRSSGGSRPR